MLYIFSIFFYCFLLSDCRRDSPFWAKCLWHWSHSGSSEQFFLCFLFELVGQHIEGKTWRERVEAMQHNTTEVYFRGIYKYQMVFQAHVAMAGFVGLVFRWLSWILRSTRTWLNNFNLLRSGCYWVLQTTDPGSGIGGGFLVWVQEHLLADLSIYFNFIMKDVRWI